MVYVLRKQFGSVGSIPAHSKIAVDGTGDAYILDFFKFAAHS